MSGRRVLGVIVGAIIVAGWALPANTTPPTDSGSSSMDSAASKPRSESAAAETGTESEMAYITETPFDELWDYDDAASTEAKFRALRPKLESDEDRSALLQLDTQIARTLSLQRKYGEAHQLLNTIEPQLESVDSVVRVRWLLERGRTFHSAGKKEPARKAFLEAWELGQEINAEAYAVDAAHMVAIVEKGDESVRWNERALEYARASEDPRAKRWKGSLLNNLGWTYHEAGDYEKAYALFREAQAFRREEGKDDETDIAEWCVGRALRSLGRVTEALALQQELMRVKKAAGRGEDGYVFEELGECLFALGREEEARPWFKKAFSKLSKDPWLKENEAERLDRLKKLSR